MIVICLLMMLKCPADAMIPIVPDEIKGVAVAGTSQFCIRITY